MAPELYDGLVHLQHRGQDAAGMLTSDGSFHLKKGAGFVREVFHDANVKRLKGDWGIGHTRYSTTGSAQSLKNAQPFCFEGKYCVAMNHNGNLTNYYELYQEMKNQGIKFETTSDIEVLCRVFAKELETHPSAESGGGGDFFETVCKATEAVYEKTKGGYSVVGVIKGKGLFAFRDPHGIRPLVWGARKNGQGKEDYIFSSEGTMYHHLGFKFMGDVGNGEVFFVDQEGKMYRKVLRSESLTPCVFEYVYFARPDALINDVSVYRSRLRMGQNLARKWKKLYPSIKPDVVIPVPNSANTAALALAGQLGVRYSEGFYKNPFVGRTFIMPTQETREKSIRRKLTPQKFEIRGKNVIVVDDSIVRGTTSREVVRLLRDFGAKRVYFLVVCPPIKFPDFYGIDIPTKNELIAANKTEEEVRQYIEADILMYQSIEGLVEAVTRKGNHKISRLSMPYLDGWYVTQDVTQESMLAVEKARTKERAVSPIKV
ncbi:MAG: amidophosphoribosyltransferase [Parcubacteria group bacterium Gr01-1014_30]|nr:MAG: amidophosphoribosyltransferase [Parcubacteria group bacterium Gr01-1014_30]